MSAALHTTPVPPDKQENLQTKPFLLCDKLRIIVAITSFLNVVF